MNVPKYNFTINCNPDKCLYDHLPENLKTSFPYGKYLIENIYNPVITFILTSCGRFDLLEQTMDSFLALNDFPIYEYIIHEDSGDQAVYEHIMSKYGHIAEVMMSDRIGLSRSIDKLVACVETPYIFHAENDWYFSGNKFFMASSLAVLQTREDINQVWIRHESDHKLPLGDTYLVDGVPVKDCVHWNDWVGYSWNPGLRRTEDIRRMFPNGHAEFEDEFLCNHHAAQFGYKAVSLVNTVCKHIGNGRHTKDFKI